MMRIAVSEQVVEVIYGTRKQAEENREQSFSCYKPPEIPGQGLMEPDLVYAIDDVWARDDADAYGKKGNDDADRYIPENDSRP
jgi:hypothetical protein